MKSKTSLFKDITFNKGLILSDFKRWGWVSALYALILFLLLPLHHMIRRTLLEENWVRASLRNSLDILSGNNGLQILLILTVPIILAVLIFRYLNNPRSSAMMHSLPFNRESLFLNHSTAGLLLLSLPVLLTGLLLMLLNITTPLSECYSLWNVGQWIGATLLFNMLFFFMTVFVGMFTGNSLAHLAFTYILNVLPFGIYILWDYNMQRLVYGYTSLHPYYDTCLNEVLPIFLLLKNNRGIEYFTGGTIFIYLIVITLFAVAAAYFYKLRNLEIAGDVISFSAVRPIFKYGVTACSMLLCGACFNVFYNHSLPFLIFGYVIGSLLGYFTAEILLNKSFRVWHKYKGYLGYVAIIAVLLIGNAADITGYVHRIPDPAQVEKAYLGYRIYDGMTKEYVSSKYFSSETDGYFFTSQNNIENITQLHKQLLKKPYNEQGNNYYLIYTLKNGKHLVRRYVVNFERNAAPLKPLYESLEYKEARFPVLTQKSADLKLIEINDERTTKKSYVLADKTEIQDFVNLLRQDLLSTSYDELTVNSPYVYITIEDYNGEKIRYNLRNSYHHILQWLKDKGYYDKIMLLPKEIAYVTVEDVKNINIREKSQEAAPTVKITDPEILQELLDLTLIRNESYRRDNSYMLCFYDDNDNDNATTAKPSWRYWLSKDTQVSETLRSYLKQLE